MIINCHYSIHDYSLLLGFRNQFVLCDECMEEVTGFSFQCLDSECSHDLSQIYDLCHKHYNNMVHSDNDHKFRVRFSYKPEDRLVNMGHRNVCVVIMWLNSLEYA